MRIIAKKISQLRGYWSKKPEALLQSYEYVDLAPTDEADKNGTYSDALLYAVNNQNVFNIALTGPYGSGKSSVIRTFRNKYEKTWYSSVWTNKKRKTLEISLASFVSEVPVNGSNRAKDNAGSESENPTAATTKQTDDQSFSLSKQEIERSILQQLLYGADANSLPLSRFRRIQKPIWPAISSLFIVLAGLSLWYLFLHKSEIASGDFIDRPQQLSEIINWLKHNGFNLGIIAVAFVVIWKVAYTLYLQTFGLSIKGISLKDVELAPKSEGEESILSRHLDEIIYFFQSTSYDLVIIEDLDRFNNPDIFVTLREINALINSNEGISRQIRFLYALRDDMFNNTDRTKFFEFILPVVPIINHSNSIDMVTKQARKLPIFEILDKQFLTDVSFHLNDLRLIKNIFNEYIVYIKQLNIDKEFADTGKSSLDVDKLLAILIYKNVLPDDFEKLHKQKGALASLLNKRTKLVNDAVSGFEKAIAKIDAKKLTAQNQLPKNIRELKQIYAMELMEYIPADHRYIEFKAKRVSFLELLEVENFAEVISANDLKMSTQPTYNFIPLPIPRDFESQVDDSLTYAQRLEDVEKKSANSILQNNRDIRVYKSKISALRIQKLSEILRTNKTMVDECFENLGDSKELMTFLVLEGYLDDTYYQYISLFHGVFISPKDNYFRIQIRSYNNPHPDVEIDNPDKIIAGMHDTDFEQSYVLNRYLFDCLLGNPAKYKTQITSAMTYISKNFGECTDFFDSYYSYGQHVPKLIESLCSVWPEFSEKASQSKQEIAHVARLLAFANLDELANLDEDFIGPCFSHHAKEVMSEGVEFDFERLNRRNIRVTDLPSLEGFPDVVKFLVEKGLYEINISNIRLVFEQADSPVELKALDTKHYSTVLGSKHEKLKQLVETDFITYVRHVLLKLNDNTDEENSAIIAALNHTEVAVEFLEEYWGAQTAILPLLSEIPDYHHSFALKHHKVTASWLNCQTYQASESYDAEALTEYLQEKLSLNQLLQDQVPAGDAELPLRQFLLNNEGLENGIYRSYMSKLPREFKTFPTDVSEDKLKILIELHRVSFTAENFDLLNEKFDLQVLYAIENISDFIGAFEEFGVDDDFRMELVCSKISDDNKRQIIMEMDLETVATDATRSGTVGPILDRTGFEASDFSFDFLHSIIANSKPSSLQVSLLNKCQGELDDNQLQETILSLPAPYSDFAKTRVNPKVANTPENRSLVKTLKSRQLVTSWKLQKGDTIIQAYKPRPKQ